MEHNMNLKVIKFSAIWCGPCKTLQPIWDQLVDDVSGVEFVSVDIDDEPKLVSRYSVSAVPTILFIKDGTVIDSLIGLHKEADIRAKVDQIVKEG